MNEAKLLEVKKSYPEIEAVLKAFGFDVNTIDLTLSFGEGHINDTLKLVDGDKKYIFQSLNTFVFPHSVELMENVVNVTEYLRDKFAKEGGDVKRGTLHFIFTKGEEIKPYFIDATGRFWRAYHYIDHVKSFQLVDRPETFRASGEAFGRFMLQLADFPADTLHETIQNFHNTKSRFQDFLKAVEADAFDRAKDVQDEIQFILDRKEDCEYLVNKLETGSLPLRVTHNDTKLNNILFDELTGESTCIIDLDTVMPGLAAYDFGDSIRFGASTALEDEKDLSKVHFNLELFEAYAQGYLGVASTVLSAEEIESLAWGAKIITLETSLRFLKDYLENDVYFKIAYDGHNVVRCRTQQKLVAEMESTFPQMLEILKRYAK